MLSDDERIFLVKNRGRIFLAAFLIVIGLLLMTIGFLKTAFLVLLGIIGWFFGRALDDKDFLKRFINNYLGK
jgi:uncharacterized membrane protein